MEGWISLHRQLCDSPLWTCEPFSRGQAWVDLLLLANHADSFFYKRGVKINVNRGQVGRSEVELSDRWKWSRNKVRKFIKDLENEQQIEQQKTNVTQLLTIVNYSKFQEKGQQAKQQKDSRRTAEGQQKDTYNNVNNENNENNVNKQEDAGVKPAKFNLRKELLRLEIKEELITDWLAIRKRKRLTNTLTAFNALKKQIELSKLSANDCIKTSVENSWGGFKAEWLNSNNLINPVKKERINDKYDRAREERGEKESSREEDIRTISLFD